MAMDDTERIINGFGNRLNELALKEAACEGRTAERLTNIEYDAKEKSGQIIRIFQSQEDLKVQVSEVKSTIKMWGAVIGILSPIIASLIAAIIARIM